MIRRHNITDPSQITCEVTCLSGLCGNNTLSFTELRKKAHPIAGYADGPGITSRFSAPESVAFVDNELIVVADTGNYLIRMINLTGHAWTLAGTTTSGLKEVSGTPLAGCPPPCLVGVQGFVDGALNESEFYNPVDVTRGTNNSVYIADEHRIRLLSFPNLVTTLYTIETTGTVVTIAGNALQGQEDGRGDEATFFQPTGVVVSGDTIAYVADRASCRVRRITPLPLVAGVRSIDCSTRAEEIVRPSGCTGFEQITDLTGRKISRVEANIQYNYGAPYQDDLDEGKRPKNCVGSPPPDTLDKHFISDGDNLVVDDHNIIINEDSEAGLSIMLYCPAGCSASDGGLRGNFYYADTSSICLAAIHSGVIEQSAGGYIQITYERSAYIWNTSYHLGETQNSITSSQFDPLIVTRVFKAERYNVSTNIVHTVAGHPSAKLTSPCGFSDGQPSTAAKFSGPSGISIRPGAIPSDEEFIFVADASNNRIRAISATCTQICENGGKCILPDTCECPAGWTGTDCTIPSCDAPCGDNKLCVAPPNVCGCKPGFEGPDCLTPQCSQDCMNGGSCSAPDTCTCANGWFDTNCTTPVCSQTCGNGGNCTSYNTCTCPEQWTGSDCRTPVCTQECKNGGVCMAPNTCICPPAWIGHGCHIPVCTQGYFRRNPTEEEKAGLKPRLYQSDILRWSTYKPCNLEGWCNATNEFECFQKEMIYDVLKLPFGPAFRKITGRKEAPNRCMLIQLPTDYTIPYQLLLAWGNNTNYVRYTEKSPYLSYDGNEWRGYTELTENRTGPWTYTPDRQLALVDWLGVSQGVYVCANDGNCTAPDVCRCAPGWIGFDCRTPVCTQGYYHAEQEQYVSGEESDTELEHFEGHLGDNLVRRNWPYSNKEYEIVIENYTDPGTVVRVVLDQGGVPYLGRNYTTLLKSNQGGYRCSVRAVTQWENRDYIFEHPNYYSRYMEMEVQRDGLIYSNWTQHLWPPTHRKSRILDQKLDGHKYSYTDEGWRRLGVWSRTDNDWQYGICIMEFRRNCTGDRAKELDLESRQRSVLTQDTDLSFRPRVSYNNEVVIGYETRWVETEGECVDEVVRGCFNNGTCVAPGTCLCPTGWGGQSCDIPQCPDTPCMHMGNCTGPNECTCEKGWKGRTCEEPICAQECNNGGTCVAPDTCKCNTFPNIFRDFRQGGGQPKYQKPNGDPADTGWTGFDCSTPICVQAERFVRNYDQYLDYTGEHIRRDPSVIRDATETPDVNANYSVFGGRGGDGTMTCIDSEGSEQPRCPQFNQVVTANDGAHFQTGCGYDPYDTGCCVYIDSSESMLRCYECPGGGTIMDDGHTFNCLDEDGTLSPFIWFIVSDHDVHTS